MSELIERLAKNWFIRNGHPASNWDRPLNAHLRESYREDVRAILKDMREPTDAMVADAMPWSDAAGAIDTWRAMVQCAASEESEDA